MTAAAAKRPTPDQRRAAMLNAAAAVFFEQGYAATSIDAIIERLGGSKRTIYNEFGNKEGLFTALVSEIADRALSEFEIDKIKGRNLRETLLDFSRHMMRLYTAPPLIGVYRSIVTEAHRFPELARTVYERGPGRATHRIAEFLEAAACNGEIQFGNCQLAAAHLIGMLRGNFHLSVVLGLRPAPSEEEIDEYVGSIIDIFLNGVTGGQSHGAKNGAPGIRRQKSDV